MVGSNILISAFVVNAGGPMNSPSDLAAFARSQPFELSACVGLGISLVLAKRLPIPNRVLLVAAIGSTLLCFYASKHAFSVENSWLREQGWLFEKKAAEPFWSVWSKHEFGRVHWLGLGVGLALLVRMEQARVRQGALVRVRGRVSPSGPYGASTSSAGCTG